MDYTSRTNQELLEEIFALKQRIKELEGLETEGIGKGLAPREHEVLLKACLENGPDGIYLSDMRGNLLYGNRKCEEITGYGQEELIGKSFLESPMLSEKSLGKAAALFDASTAGRPTGPDEIEVINKDGRLLLVEISTSVIESMGRKVILGFLRDITERKQERESLLKTQFAMDRAPDSVLWIDDEACIVYANDSACTSMGFTRRELLKMKVFDIDPDFLPDNWEKHKENVRRLGAMTFESRHITKDGRSFPVEVSTNLFGADCDFLACAFDRDITTRKQVEEELKRRSEAMAASVDGMTIVNGNEEFIYVNDAHARMHGYDKSDHLVGKNWRVLYNADEIERFEKEVMPKFLEEGRWHGEAAGRKMNGSEFPEELSLTVLRDGGFISVVRDITSRKKAENAQRESERKFRDLAEKSVAGIYLIQDGILRYVNARISEILGYPIDEMIDRMPLKDLICPEDWPLVEVNMKRRLAGEPVPQNYEFRLLTKYGEVRTVEVYSSRTVYQGRPAVIGTLLDITERKEAERKIIESERSLSAILAASPIGIGMAKDRKILWVNETLCRFTGYTQEELQGRSASIFYESLEEYEIAGEILYREERVQTKMVKADGEVRDVLIQLRFTDPESCILYLHCR